MIKINKNHFKLIYLLIFLLYVSDLNADPYPPYWGDGVSSSIHFQPVKWPNDL